jgi:hypothetical protein
MPSFYTVRVTSTTHRVFTIEAEDEWEAEDQAHTLAAAEPIGTATIEHEIDDIEPADPPEAASKAVG